MSHEHRAIELQVRPARPEDREAVVAFTAHTWGEHGDYIYWVWEGWLNDARGPLLVGLLDGEAVALVKITWNSPGEAWMEGMRVHPERRGQGLATQILHRALEWAAAQGGRIVRLATAADNVPAQRMAAAAGMQRVHTSIDCDAAALPEGEMPVVLPVDRGDEIWAGIERWGGLSRSHGLYCWAWGWRPLMPTLLREHLQAGQVLGADDAAGKLAAVAIVDELSDGDEGLFVGFLDGTAEGIARLAAAMRVLVRRCNPPRVEGMVRDEAALWAVLEGAGYKQGWSALFWILEGSLEVWKR